MSLQKGQWMWFAIFVVIIIAIGVFFIAKSFSVEKADENLNPNPTPTPNPTSTPNPTPTPNPTIVTPPAVAVANCANAVYQDNCFYDLALDEMNINHCSLIQNSVLKENCEIDVNFLSQGF